MVIVLPAVAAVSHRRHSWGHANPATCGDNTRSVFGCTDRNGGRTFGCSKGQSRNGQPGLAAAPLLAGGPGRSTEAVGCGNRCTACGCHHRGRASRSTAANAHLLLCLQALKQGIARSTLALQIGRRRPKAYIFLARICAPVVRSKIYASRECLHQLCLSERGLKHAFSDKAQCTPSMD